MKIIFNGLGEVGSEIFMNLLKKKDLEFSDYFISHKKEKKKISGMSLTPIKLSKGNLDNLKNNIIIDFTVPEIINKNINFYLKNNLNFICGTTGVDYKNLEKKIKDSKSLCVVSPNMVKEIIVFMEMFRNISEQFPNIFKNYKMEIIESHQQNKKDVSGTAKKMVEFFNFLGINFSENQIKKIRDSKSQEKFGVKKKYLSGHAYHTYKITSPENNVFFEFKHNIDGRGVYTDGVYSAIIFLNKKRNIKKGKFFSMTDVLKK